MSSGSTVLLTVSESGTPAARSYAFTIMINGQTLDDRTLSPVESQELGEVSGQYQMLFDQSRRSKTTDYLEILGSGLFHLFFENVWGQIKIKASDDKIRLAIASDIPKVLNLPWEIVQPPDGEVLGLDPAFSILRLPGQLEALPQFKGQLPPGPLRVVFVACSPRQSIDYLREEESFAKALERLDVAWDSCDLGTYEELKKRVDEFEPQIVHLVGQEVVKDGNNYFAFEGDSGLADLRSSVDIQRALPGVQLVLFSGFQGKNPSILANLGIELVKADMAMAMNWPGSIADGESAIRAFYEDLASGNTLYRANASMRRKIMDVNKKGTVLLAFPTLYCRTDQDRTFDPQQRAVLPGPLLVRQPPQLSMTEGYSENFVGRKRELQRLVPALREGRVKTVIITGPVGSGKSTLAVRLAREPRISRILHCRCF